MEVGIVLRFCPSAAVLLQTRLRFWSSSTAVLAGLPWDCLAVLAVTLYLRGVWLTLQSGQCVHGACGGTARQFLGGAAILELEASVLMTVGQTRHLLSSAGPVHSTGVLVGTSVMCSVRHLRLALAEGGIPVALQGVTLAHLTRLRGVLVPPAGGPHLSVHTPGASVEAKCCRLHLSSPRWRQGWRRFKWGGQWPWTVLCRGCARSAGLMP